MGINYEKLLERNQRYVIDTKLLNDIEYNEILFIISKEIIKYREENNLKQKELAEKLSISQEMVSKMESGRYNYTIKSLVNLWNDLSTDTLNFGAELIRKIYDRIIKNYNTIYAEVEEPNFIEEFKFKEEKKELKTTFETELNININAMNENEIFRIAC